MTSLFETTARPRPSFAELFTPKLMTVLREGYGPRQFHVDAIAGLTVAIVALPLSMAIAIASGVSPERGLYTAIIGGFLVSALGGSRFQIGGPAGAFIVLGAGIVEWHGYDGLALATLMAGIVMIAVGLLRLGTYVKYIPFPVTVGFTAVSPSSFLPASSGSCLDSLCRANRPRSCPSLRPCGRREAASICRPSPSALLRF